MIIAQPERTSHWYSRDGKAFYTFRNDKGEEKNVTLREARKERAFPSVTSILGTVHKPMLEAWKIEQAILASLTLPRNSGESETDFAKRVVKDSREHCRQAASLGTELHAQAEAMLLKAPFQPNEYSVYIEKWIAENVVSVESVEIAVINSALGYGGKVDFIGEIKSLGPCIVDFKSQAVRDGKAAFYDEFPLQLEAYRNCLPHPENYRLLSVIIPTREPAALQAKAYEMIDHGKYFETFLAAFQIWKYINKYDPTK